MGNGDDIREENMKKWINHILGYTVFTTVCFLYNLFHPYDVEGFLGYFFLMMIPIISFVIIISIFGILLKLKAVKMKGLIILLINMAMQLVFLIRYISGVYFNNIFKDFMGLSLDFQIMILIPLASVIFAVVALKLLWDKQRKS